MTKSKWENITKNGEEVKVLKGENLNEFLSECKEAGIFSNQFYLKVLGNIVNQMSGQHKYATVGQVTMFQNAIDAELEKGKAGKKFLELI